MTKKIWTFSPYNEEKYKKSKNRVMFVGAEPNGEKQFKDGKGKKIEINDMGKWFRTGVESTGTFYKRTMIMLDGILPHINDSQRKDHMRFIDLKNTAGGSEATTDGIRTYIENKSNAKEVSNYFIDPKTFPHFVILLGGHVHTLFFEFRKNKKLSFHDKTKAVCMPHPKPREGTPEELKIASKNLNIKNLKNKFRPIMEPLWRWSIRTKNWSGR